MNCKHTTALQHAAGVLTEQGYLRTFDAVYHWYCPNCGAPKRTTRLSDTIYTLRHAYGWEITTVNTPGGLAEYVLDKAGDMPGEGTTPHPRRLVRTGVAGPHPLEAEGYVLDPAPEPQVRCAVCGTVRASSGTAWIGGWTEQLCDSEQCRRMNPPNFLPILRTHIPVVKP